ncbi:MAG: hypothetical protein HW416_614 [Chloroflexi bacterium]|nr:hypothetical protein [Chloroflexota bacterium]
METARVAANAGPPDAETVVLTATDGVQLNGLYRAPNDPLPVGVLLIHGFGGTYQSPPVDNLADALAANGRPTLALNTRDYGCCVYRDLFEDSILDLAAGVQYLQSTGATSVVLVGYSLGANKVAYYYTQTRDPAVHSMVLLASAGNTNQGALELGGERARLTLAEAARRVQDNDRASDLMPIPLGRLAAYLATPTSVMSYAGPDSASDHLKWADQIDVPLLLVHGSADQIVSPEQSTHAIALASQSHGSELVILEGADHGFSGYERSLAETVESWITFLP